MSRRKDVDMTYYEEANRGSAAPSLSPTKKKKRKKPTAFCGRDSCFKLFPGHTDACRSEYNRSFHKSYPIGMVAAMWGITQDIYSYLDEEERKILKKVDAATDELMETLKKRRYPKGM